MKTFHLHIRKLVTFVLLNTLILVFGTTSAFLESSEAAENRKTYESEGQKFQVETLTDQEDVIWGFDFLPDGRMLFTQKKGKLAILDPESKTITQISATPKVYDEGQGGLLDIRVAPSAKKNAQAQIYFTYSDPVGDDKASTTLATALLTRQELTQFKKIFTAHEPNDNDIHFGSRIEFDQKGHIFISIGDRGDRDKAQDLSYHQGKILRLNLDGSVPKDNPFITQKTAKPEIWSLGHRSPQGLVFHPVTGELWEAEMGPRGGDEINLISPGKNYGWPIITYGKEYTGGPIGPGSKAGLEQPITYWVPSISPSGMTFYNGDKFPKWKSNAFLANLSGLHVRRLVFKGNQVIGQENLLEDLNLRFRNIRPGPDGSLYISTDDGKILRLVPVK